ncbi:ribokinase [Pantoea ananatis]|nr:ribokinase [Pantoea ananatis]
MMFLEERRNQILQWLDEHERVTVNGLASQLRVTRETIRTDLRALAEQGLVQRCYGGAIVQRRNLQEKLISESGHFDVLLKRLQARKTTVKTTSRQGKVCILGAFNVDIVARVARFPQSGESLMAQGSTLGPGGKGANQAMAASRAGARVHFVAKVGTDRFSQFAFDHLSSSDIHSFRLYQTDTEPTGSAIIYVSQENGENMIAIYPGANKTLTDAEIAELTHELTDADVLLLQLENNVEATRSAIRLAHTLGVRIIMNPAPFSSEVVNVLPMIDVLTPNETEASRLSGIEIFDMASARKAAQAIVAQGAQRVIITMGALLFDAPHCHVIPAFPALSVDTTGAGDAFNGALAAALAQGQPLLQAATWASAFASLAVEREGASNMPKRHQVITRLNQR